MTEKRIHRLPSIVIDRIAAGEVIEGPSSVAKELLENAVDSGAKNVLLQTRAGGLDEVIVQDDGGGILFEDLPDSVFYIETTVHVAAVKTYHGAIFIC